MKALTAMKVIKLKSEIVLLPKCKYMAAMKAMKCMKAMRWQIMKLKAAMKGMK